MRSCNESPLDVPINPVTTKLSMSNPPEPMFEHAIRCRAYELYVQRGMAPGHVLTVDWNVAGIRFVKSATTTILRPHSHRTSPQQALRKASLYFISFCQRQALTRPYTQYNREGA